MKKELVQTKGQFKLMGKVKGIENENALREGTTQGKDQPYKSLSFFVETSPTNAIKVEIFAMERDEVFFYSSKAKETKRIPWDKRHSSLKEYKLIGTRLGLEKGEDGKNKQVMMVEWDAVDYILDNLKDGDSVFVNGTINFRTYKDKNSGDMKESKSYAISGISHTKKPIDFDAEDFSEMASFEQDIVVTDVTVLDGKLHIGAKIIGYKSKKGDQEVADTTFIVDPEVDGGKYKKLANNMKKRLKYGDAIKLFGLCINSVELVAGEETEEEEDDWGGEKPAGMDNMVRNYTQELRVTAVDSSTYEPKKYTEEDFFSDDEDSFGDDDSDFDGDDFGDDEETGLDDDDDLPFE
jgi:hypothetical protein